jgi:hypothetical protein
MGTGNEEAGIIALRSARADADTASDALKSADGTRWFDGLKCPQHWFQPSQKMRGLIG